ncbi:MULTISPECIES: anhydro-N-acetylmuramic acid kinase [Flavobacterium]|uniref:Anhydro-N-acetylmuramic acid kinase n=2 Tax=Flavobacterium TaxID=237 RepID=A0A437U9R5_9FLAO|nr:MULTISPECIES: anhydro-N-acetylmuramic acid kinase [Flavobacterium]OWP84462.1 anhydro-N-acetylmuramic acid kinase [Flavobacterium davisii]QYS89186.1 anhydro-N-acetylmuramic acid kinase [Flavobacterium davisii]RVU90353.1 anhydro-N-acetylmuramic acid kinase [Flavobacterium columnare]SPE77964.1 Anhydro-N-acetylmuramic acid kinase [Flavobacterium columnare]
MEKKFFNVIGVMSGTSLDGVDLAHIFFKEEDQTWKFEILEVETVPYDQEWVLRLKLAVNYNQQDLEKLNEDYTLYLSSIINKFINQYQLNNVDAICSHGHTILHQPEKGITLQIGNLPMIAHLVKQTVVCDFRVQDVNKGGQGAPLVPIGDHILFSDFDYCLNLGGFSNISFQLLDKRIAFDISPVNTVLNFFAEKTGNNFDDKGAMARSGSINHSLLMKLNQLAYYQLPFPKSLGIEYVKSQILPIIKQFEGLSIPDILCTFSEHIAVQIKNVLLNKSGKMLVTGGGVYNDYLIERIRNNNPNIKVLIPDQKIIEFKEALIFAFLGVLKLENKINVLSSVTGASEDHSAGYIYKIKSE